MMAVQNAVVFVLSALLTNLVQDTVLPVSSFQSFGVRSPHSTLSVRLSSQTVTTISSNKKTSILALPRQPSDHWNRHIRTQSAFPTTSSSLAAKSSSLAIDDAIVRSDVLVLGSGPAARSIASLLSNSKSSALDSSSPSPIDVIVADKNFDRPWSPNYGVWQDEWEAVSKMFNDKAGINVLDDCINRKWKQTECFFGGSYDIPAQERFQIPRPYWRVDRDVLRKSLTPESEGGGEASKLTTPYRVIRENHTVERSLAPNLYTPSNAIIHDEFGSTVTLSDGTVVRTKLIIDCTGHESKIVKKETRATDKPGFQIAYGAMLVIDEQDPTSNFIGPYDKDAMTLFDYRTDHFADESSPQWLKAQQAPTFNYVMPIDGNRVFVEETSLVARPAVSFMECKERLMARLEHHGIKILEVEEEEFCYIPMGGALPAKDQRVIGFGGAAATVHPSTGYHICRMMASASDVATAIEGGLRQGENQTKQSKLFNPDRTAASAYDAIWSPSNIRQRHFAVFGGEYLMKQKVDGLRGFFDGFFRCPEPMWAGFLAGWPGLPNNETHETWLARIFFGLTFVSKLPLPVAVDMVASILYYSVTEPGFPLLQSVTPFFGEPESFETVEKPKLAGDVAAKAEARKMLSESVVEKFIPVPLED
jgi:lycopene beta-cyclase